MTEIEELIESKVYEAVRGGAERPGNCRSLLLMRFGGVRLPLTYHVDGFHQEQFHCNINPPRGCQLASQTDRL